jgi:hypothetical protein
LVRPICSTLTACVTVMNGGISSSMIYTSLMWNTTG